MTNPASLIADLDAALADAGETVTVRRYTAPTGSPRPKIDIEDVPAAVRPVKPDELVGDIQQSDRVVVMSPTQIGALLPMKIGDKLLIAGAEVNVQFAGHIRVQNVVVRIKLMVRG
ncbi:hypothetical protein [Mesorhizobium sp. B2-3-6]|uniref:hypothetical protein n=1 Tax=Mesorhizobium sp. B2-3-6 TaxID=2589957 RepID=UPI001128D885|nr:hypothetical protein [Mesorhizobium sp. B2-3-6]TPM19778.1 hypothetical protein FJ953_15365 [Mesorhizobium sp. B2-3-6]